MSTTREPRALLQATSAYLLWGLFPLYFLLLSSSGPLEVVAHRALWSLLFCLVLALATRRGREFLSVIRRPRLFAPLALAALLLSANWCGFVWGVNNGRALDAALGYYINPLVSACLGIAFLGEKLRRAQIVAFALGALAAVVLILAYGQVPWIAFLIAITWGIYGLVKHGIGARVGAVAGFTAETLALAPLAGGYLIYLAATHTATVGLSPYLAVVAASGVVTAVPLLLFAAAAPHVPLTVLGMLQYIAPSLIFLVGLGLGEPMPPARWVGFALVWLAIAVFAADAVRTVRTPSLRSRNAVH